MLSRVYILVFLFFLAAAATASHARNPRLRIEGLYWMPGLSAEGRIDDNDMDGSDIDFKDDLGLSDSNFPVGRVSLRLGQNHRLRLGYTRLSYDGDENIDQTIAFAGQEYTANRRVITDFDMHYAQLGWSWQFINLLDRRFRLGTLLDIKAMDIEAKLEAPEQDDPTDPTQQLEAQDESGSIAFAFPTVGLVLDIALFKRLSFYAEGAGIYAGSYGWLADGEAGLRLAPLGLLSSLRLVGGYRMLRVDAEDGDDYFDLRIGGPFAGLSLNF